LKGKKITGEILTTANVSDCNTFENPNVVRPSICKEVEIIDDHILNVNISAKSIITLEENKLKFG
jgi:alpha-N-arabinofuranosidase